MTIANQSEREAWNGDSGRRWPLIPTDTTGPCTASARHRTGATGLSHVTLLQADAQTHPFDMQGQTSPKAVPLSRLPS